MTHLERARQYEADVGAGRVPACRWVRLACARNQRDVARQGTPAFPYVVDPVKAEAICLCAEQLPHVKGPKAQVVSRDEDGRATWAPIALEPWQSWYLTTLFGWVHQETGRRRFRVALLLVPRKNAKSTIAAVIVLYMLTADGESGAECYSAATTRDQAKVVAEIAWEMAKRSPAFCEYFGVRVGAATTRTLTVQATASKFAPLSADANTLDALNVSLAVIDELHAHPTRAVWDVLDTATGARPQPLLLATTTAGVSIGGICYEKMTYLHRILDSAIVDEQFFGTNYTIDEGDDWRSVAALQKANPNYGVSVSEEDLARKVQEAQHSPAAVNNFLTKHCNVWVHGEATWAPMEAWRAAADSSLTVAACAAAPCWIGVDLAEVRDIAAVVLVFKRSETSFAVFGRYYLPAATIAKSPIAALSGWVRDGRLIETDGDQADFARIEADIVTLCRTYRVQQVCFDRALSAQMGQQLTRLLGGRPEVLTVNQNVEVMNPAMQTVERLILAGQLAHDGDPMLTWMFSNVVVQRNYRDELFPMKSGGKDSPHKIDGAVALFTVIGQVMAAKRYAGLQVHFLGGKA